MNNNQNTSEMRTITPDGTVPKTRIGTVAEAMAIVRRCINDNLPRTRTLVRMKSLVDGESPYSAHKLRANGQGYRSNLNPMDAAAHLQAAMVPYYDLFATQMNFIEVETDAGGPNDAVNFSRIITEEVDTYLRQDPEFLTHMRSMIYWRVGYGCGTCIYKDSTTPAFKTIPPYKFYVPGKALASVKMLEIAVIELEFEVTDLYERIKDESAAREAGWNPDEVKRAITAAGNSVFANTLDYGTFQQLIKNNQWVGSTHRVVRCARLFWKEFDGTVSECVVRMDTETGGQMASVDEDDPRTFLYRADSKYKSMDQVAAAFFQESSEGYWHGATGQLQMSYNVLSLKARQFNAIQDGAFMRAGPTLRAISANATEKAAMTQWGPCNIISNQFEVQPATIMGDLQSVMEVSQYNDNTVFQNTGVYRTRMDRPVGNPRTAREVELQFETAQALSNSAVDRFLSELDVFYRELVRRMLQEDISTMIEEYQKPVKELRDRIVARGVPKEVLKEIDRVQAPRGIGTVARNLKAIQPQDFAQMAGLFEGRGMKNFIEDYCAAKYGYRMAKRWVGDGGPTPGDEDQMWDAQQESTLLQHGNQPYITSTQDDFIHAGEHLREASAAVQSIQQGADKVAVLAYLQATGQHVADHLQRIQHNPMRQKEVQGIVTGIKQLSQVAHELEQMIQEEQQQNATQQKAQDVASGVDPEVQLKAAKMNADMQLKKEKQDKQLALKEESAKKNFALQDAKTAHDIILKNAQAQAAATEPA